MNAGCLKSIAVAFAIPLFLAGSWGYGKHILFSGPGNPTGNLPDDHKELWAVWTMMVGSSVMTLGLGLAWLISRRFVQPKRKPSILDRYR